MLSTGPAQQYSHPLLSNGLLELHFAVAYVVISHNAKATGVLRRSVPANFRRFQRIFAYRGVAAKGIIVVLCAQGPFFSKCNIS